MKRLCSAIFCVLLTGSFFATDIKGRLETILPSSVVVELLAQSKMQNSVYRQKGFKPTLVPAIPLAKDAFAYWSGEEAPFTIETLYLYKKASTRVCAPGLDIDTISVILRSISHLEGIEYYSTSRKKMRTLYEKSYVVDQSMTRKRIPDPINGTAEGLSLNAIQKDLTFGEYLYNYTYRQNSDCVAFYSRNIDEMSYSFIKLIEPDKLHVSLVVYDMGDYLLVYGLTRVNFLAVPGLEGKINSSFSTRADAVYNWFLKEYEKK